MIQELNAIGIIISVNEKIKIDVQRNGEYVCIYDSDIKYCHVKMDQLSFTTASICFTSDCSKRYNITVDEVMHDKVWYVDVVLKESN